MSRPNSPIQEAITVVPADEDVEIIQEGGEETIEVIQEEDDGGAIGNLQPNSPTAIKLYNSDSQASARNK